LSNSLKCAGIIATGSYVPEDILTNFDLEQMVDTSNEWIVTRTGIEERRVAAKDVATSDIATKAALNALEKAGMSAEEIDLIIVATITPDMAFPSTACIVQKNIGAKNAAAFDLEAACSGFVYGMTVAEQFVKTGFYKNIMVIGAETLSKILDYNDRNTCILFGDGAGAAIISEVEEGYGILSSCIGANGYDGHLLTQPAGGSRIPATVGSVEDRLHVIKMDGNEVFKFAIRVMGQASEEALEKCGLTKEDIDFLVPHQANIRIIDSALKRLKISPDRAYVNLNKYGNMSAASIIVALDEAIEKGHLKDEDVVVLVGFGAGLTWGASVLKWKDYRRS
jgi:3-oxoacyl-[acyl-carrier-protein] synthase-3